VMRQCCWLCNSAIIDVLVLLMWFDRAVHHVTVPFLMWRYCRYNVTVPLLTCWHCQRDATALSVMRQCRHCCVGTVDVVQQCCWSCNSAAIDVLVLLTGWDSDFDLFFSLCTASFIYQSHLQHLQRW
jgi:hypothetical protein